MKKSTLQGIQVLLILVLVSSAIWLCFGPVQLGGSVSYVIISGNSMEPNIHLGDLVVARKQPLYQVDQQVVYNNPKVGYVFHRIVDQSKGKFTLKGDNNDWLDSYQPTSDEVLGKLWYVLPSAGSLLRTLREPRNFVLLIVGIILVTFFLFIFPKQGNTGKKKGSKKHMNKSNQPGSGSDLRIDLVFSLAVLAIAAIILGVVAFTKPLTINVKDQVFYQHNSSFSYTANVDEGVYDRGGIDTGDPIYPLLTCKVKMLYSYQFSSPDMNPLEKKDFQGSILLTAVLSDADGWNRTFLLLPEYKFSGTAISAPVSLDICRMQEIITNKEIKTGTELRLYSLSIIPEINLVGSVSDISYEETYQPEIRFVLEDNVLRVPEQDIGFDHTQEGFLAETLEIPNSLVIFGKAVKVETIRIASAIGLGVSILASIYPIWSIISDWKTSVVSRIKVQNQPLLVDIDSGSVKKRGQTVINVSSFQDLRKMADRFGGVILHEEDGQKHNYYVVDEGTLYRFSMDVEAEPSLALEDGDNPDTTT